MGNHVKYNAEWFKKSYSRLFLDKESDWLLYKRTAGFACESLDKKSLVLEVGCGLGGLSYRLASYCGNVVGVDISEYACAQAKLTYKSSNINFVTADVQYLPFKSEAFDGVVASHLFEHLDDKEAKSVQQEIYRVLKPGAAFTVEQPAYGKETVIDIILLYLFSSRKNKELYYYTKKAIKETSRQCPGVDFHHLAGIGDITHKRIYDLKLLISELKNAGFTKFCFYRRTIFNILFLGNRRLFESYVWFYLKVPEIIRKVLLVTPITLVKAIKK